MQCIKIILYSSGLTGSKDGQELLFQCTETITALGKLTEDKDSTVSKESLLCLVNLSANDDGGEVLLKTVRWPFSLWICSMITFLFRFFCKDSKFGRIVCEKY